MRKGFAESVQLCETLASEKVTLAKAAAAEPQPPSVVMQLQ